MPIYEYVCQGCEHEFETIQKMSDEALTRCPACGKDLLRKKISAVAFRLKGGGWYETDFKSGDKKNVASGSDSGESSSTGASTKEAKSETKPNSGSSGDGSSTAATGSTSKPTKESSKAADKDSGSGKRSASKDGAKRAPKNGSKTGGGGDKSVKN
jgi:putative FmdB family regulatory protein